jgi:hypothetical protein
MSSLFAALSILHSILVLTVAFYCYIIGDQSGKVLTDVMLDTECWIMIMPTTAAERSKARNVFTHSNTQGMNICPV